MLFPTSWHPYLEGGNPLPSRDSKPPGLHCRGWPGASPRFFSFFLGGGGGGGGGPLGMADFPPTAARDASWVIGSPHLKQIGDPLSDNSGICTPPPRRPLCNHRVSGRFVHALVRCLPGTGGNYPRTGKQGFTRDPCGFTPVLILTI